MKYLTKLAAVLVAFTLAVPMVAQAQMATADECNDIRLLTMEKRIFLGDGILPGGALINGYNAIDVHRADYCGNIDPSLLEELSFCVNIWDTTPCEGGLLPTP